MKKRKKRKKKLESQLLAYGVAAGTALAMAPSVRAAIQYTPAHITLDSNTPSAGIDIDNDGFIDEFSISYWSAVTAVGAFSYWGARVIPVVNAAVFEGSGFFPSIPARLSFGAPISTAHATWDTGSGPLFSNFRCYGVYANFTHNNGNPAYLGIQFNPGDGTRYGWIRIEDIALDYTSLSITGWAYEDLAGASILAGEGGTPVPIPSSLALLAAGAAGLAALRRRNREKSEPA